MSTTKLNSLIQTYTEYAPQNFEFNEEVIQIIKNVYAHVCKLPHVEIVNEPNNTSLHNFKAVINLKNYDPNNIKAKKEVIQLLSTYLGEEVRQFVDKSQNMIYIHNPMVISFKDHFIHFSITYGT